MDLEHEQRLKNSLHFAVSKMCEEQGSASHITFEKKTMATINEIVWRQIGLYSKDLEAFAKHAKRSTVTLDDVKLLARRNEDLKSRLDNLPTSANPEESVRGKSLVTKRKSGAVRISDEVTTLEADDHDTFM